MDKMHITTLVCFALMAVIVIWVLVRGEKIDDDIDIEKNKYHWWKDKNLK